jgi:hypothetical protein
VLCSRRELAPRPLGCWVRGTEARLLYAAPAGGHLPANGLAGEERAAWSRPRAVSQRLGRIEDPERPPLLGFAAGRSGRLEAFWLDPGRLALGHGNGPPR